MVGRILGNRYRINKQLGKGGHGSVYLCHDNKLHKDWAVKELEEPSDLERSMELELLKTISCSAFPRIVDIVKENGRVFLVMDYVEGITLKEKMKHQVLTEREVLPWAKEIVKGMDYLHRMSVPILYMDCKPDNIMLTNSGEVRLVDLGSAYVCFKDKKQRISGTRYFAPKEQYKRGMEQDICVPDVRTDIYAFGMTLYYLLSGGKREQRSGGRLCIKDVNPSVSWGMSHIIEKCTMENPEQRYQSMEEVMEQLQHVRRLGKQRAHKECLLRILVFGTKVLCACMVLFLAYGYRKQGVYTENCLYLIFPVVVLFLLLCFPKRKIMYEWNKDIFCGMGKKFLYLLLLVGGVMSMSRVSTFAAENKSTEAGGRAESTLEEERLKLVIYDEFGRKILIKDGASWEIENDIVLALPIEELESGKGRISVCYESEFSDARKRYSFDIVKETD